VPFIYLKGKGLPKMDYTIYLRVYRPERNIINL
jgi:hypothetical protein